MSDTADWDLAVDVVVAGIGLAGGAAAITAHDAGASVLVLEKEDEDHCGGNSRVSGNCWWENLDEDAAAKYLVSMSGDDAPAPELVRVWAKETARNSAWVQALDVPISLLPGSEPPEFPDLPGADAYGGMNVVGDTWGMSRLWQAVYDAVRRRDIDVRLSSPITDLVLDGTRVVGVTAVLEGVPRRIRARRGVVLATGGFEASEELVREHLGVEGGVPWGSPANTGDGIAIAVRAGADLWHMNNYMPMVGLAAPGWRTGFHIAPQHRGLVFVDSSARRFANEFPPGGHGHSLIDGSYQIFPPPGIFVVFDEQTRVAGPLYPPVERSPYSWNAIIEGYRWSDDNSVELEQGWFTRADTVEDLAAALGMDPTALRDTIQRYNAACAAGSDDDFGRDPASLLPLATPPYYGFFSPPVVGYTCGGPRRDERARALRPDGTVVDGLYCAGELSSTYSWCMDGGMMIGDALVFGRVAGLGAAAG
jgi:succinate dehydrogenase/fumarate reductase flavoprotein subunit